MLTRPLLQSIFADDTYAKPFFLTYLNGTSFMLAMVPSMSRRAWIAWRSGVWDQKLAELKRIYRRGGWRAVSQDPGVENGRDSLAKDLEEEDTDDSEGLLQPDDEGNLASGRAEPLKRTHLALVPTATLAFKFCLLWFFANYFAMACLKYTTVASTTILTSTSSVWTLLIGALTRTEKFTWRKLAGVLASLFGIILISKIDIGNASDSASPDTTTTPADPALFARAPSSFPSKTTRELALGDTLALISAILYGLYTVMLKQTTISASPLELNMPLFFGLVGAWNIFLLLPFFPILHYTGIEPFALPSTARIWWILVLNSVSALASDLAWAYAMVLTSPLVVTVGLSLTIPLSLVGEMVIQGRYEGWLYWLGAAVVVGSFVFVDREERGDEVLSERDRVEERVRRSLEARAVGAEEMAEGELLDR
jgi:solute carrier family 35, member F5